VNEDTGLTSSLGARYMGSQFLNTTNTTLIGSYLTFSGAVGVRYKNYEATLNMENLLNRERYFVSQINGNQLYPGAPVNAFVSLRYRFN
jgi:outer membrane receptor protein involved in Fe transport